MSDRKKRDSKKQHRENEKETQKDPRERKRRSLRRNWPDGKLGKEAVFGERLDQRKSPSNGTD